MKESLCSRLFTLSLGTTLWLCVLLAVCCCQQFTVAHNHDATVTFTPAASVPASAYSLLMQSDLVGSDSAGLRQVIAAAVCSVWKPLADDVQCDCAENCLALRPAQPHASLQASLQARVHVRTDTSLLHMTEEEWQTVSVTETLISDIRLRARASKDPVLTSFASSLHSSSAILTFSTMDANAVTASPTISPTPTPRREGSSSSGDAPDIAFAIGLIIGISVGISILMCWVFFIYFYCCKPKRPMHHKVNPNYTSTSQQMQSIFTVSQKRDSALDSKVNAAVSMKTEVQLFQSSANLIDNTEDVELASHRKDTPPSDIIMYDLSCKPLSS